MDKLDDLVEMAEKADAVANLMDAVNPHDILAIAEAFRELEQRAEVAEVECSRLDRESQNLSYQLGQCDRERRAALAKLAELEKQKPVGNVSIAMDWNTHRNVATVNLRPDLVVSEMKDGDELFTRPAPAAVPVDVVPDAMTLNQAVEFVSQLNHESLVGTCQDTWQACCDEMLRRIEGLK